jgi:pimeloyl-ACP methyl ester carboxylesterase
VATRTKLVLLVVAALLVVAGALVYADFRRDIAAHYERVAHGSRVIDTRCGPVELAEAGSGPPFLVVHGTGGGFDQAMLAGDDFAARGWRVLAPSRFGYLRTPYPADASAEAQADQFVCLLDALGVERVPIMGISAGANSTLQFAIRHPERTSALVLLVPATYKPPAAQLNAQSNEPQSKNQSNAALERTLSPVGEKVLMTIVGSDFPFWAVTRLAPDTAVRTVLATPPEVLAQASGEDQQRAARVLDSILPISARTRGLLNDARIAGHPTRHALESIRTPTLIVSVRDDLFGTYASAQYTAQHIAGARFIGFEQGGHIWLGHHAKIVAATDQFMREDAHAAEGGR